MRNDISIARILSMILIISCHLFSWIGIPALSQLLNVGTFVFLIISGYLYADKQIHNPVKWLFERWKKLCVPLLIWFCFIVLLDVVVFKVYPGIVESILFLLNLQGIGWIITSIPTIGKMGGVLGSIGHLWFVTVIFACYFLLVVIKGLEQKKCFSSTKILIVICLLYPLLLAAGINIVYLIAFTVGYASGKTELLFEKKTYMCVAVGMVIAICMRLFFRNRMDGTFFYDTVVVDLSQTVLGVWIFETVLLLCKNIGFINRMGSTRLVLALDTLSYYIYLTHYYFLGKQVDLRAVPGGIAVQLLVFAILALISAVLLNKAHMLLKNVSCQLRAKQ